MAFELPNVSGLTDAVTSKLSKLDPSKCGSNEALTALDDVQDKIKEALAGGKGVLSDISSAVSEANAKLEEGLTKIQSEIDDATRSFQEEVASLQTKIGEDFAAAKAKIQEEWGDAVDGIEDTLSKVPSLSDILSGGDTLDLCKEVQNYERKETVMADGDVYVEYVKKAQAPQMPNENSSEPAKFEEKKVEVQQQPSVVSPSGLSRYETNSEMMDHRIQRQNLINNHFAPLKKEIMAEWKALKADPMYAKLKQDMKDTGKKASQLREEGYWSMEEIAFSYRAKNAETLNKGFNNRMSIFKGLLGIHEEVIGGVAAADDYEKNLKKWIDAGVIKDIDVEKLGWQVQADINSADLIKAYYSYQNKV